MFQVEKIIVSEAILDRKFVCDLKVCLGNCCVEGEAGAPVTLEETLILENLFPIIRSYLRKGGIKAIEKQGTHTVSRANEKEFETTLVNKKECAYVVFAPSGIAKCGIEVAYNKGAINFQKPISCHLYPIRIQEYSHLTAVNYHSWSICKDACILGEKQKIPAYQFAREALIRKFGNEWYTELDKLAQEYYENIDK